MGENDSLTPRFGIDWEFMLEAVLCLFVAIWFLLMALGVVHDTVNSSWSVGKNQRVALCIVGIIGGLGARFLIRSFRVHQPYAEGIPIIVAVMSVVLLVINLG